MIGLYSLIGAACVLLWGSPVPSHSAAELDWATVCNPRMCRCKWVSGQKLADCANSSHTSIPANLSNEVQVLDLSNNYITELDKDAFKSVGLINLHKLIARGCSIEKVDKDAFCGLKILIELDLSDNNIHVLHPATFRDPFRLRKIYLNRNPVQRLQNYLFHNMSFLQTVELNNCLITHIEPKTFFNNTKLNSLALSGNQLVNMKPDVLYSIPSLMNLEISNNPWRCDCKLRPLMDLVSIPLYTCTNIAEGSVNVGLFFYYLCFIGHEQESLHKVVLYRTAKAAKQAMERHQTRRVRLSAGYPVSRPEHRVPAGRR